MFTEINGYCGQISTVPFRLGQVDLHPGAHGRAAVVVSIGSLMLNLLFYRMRLIPRWLLGWGMIGSVLYCAAPMVSMFIAGHPAMSLDNPMGFLLGPLALEEMVFAVWVIVKGFNTIEGKADTA